MTTSERIPIIGVGDDGLEGLTAASRKLIQDADLLIGSQQALAVASAATAEKLDIGGDLDAIIDRINIGGDQRIAVLMIGDPLFYGTARFLCERLGKERFEVK